MRLSGQEKRVVEVLESFGFSNVEKSCMGWSFAQPAWLLTEDRYRKLFIKVEPWGGKFSIATVGSHWTVEEAIKMQGQLDFAIKVLLALVEVAPEMVDMEHPIEA